MKKGIHPEYQETVVKCLCGNEFTTRSTLKEIKVEICSACHPFFTGQQKLVDSAGRVERFVRKYGKSFGAQSAVGADSAEEAAGAPSEGPGEDEKADDAPPTKETAEGAEEVDEK